MQTRFEGKTCMVAGAASGIGRARALRFAREGGRLALCDLAGADTAGLTREIADLGAESIEIALDVTHREACEAAVESAVERLGSVDVLVWDRVMAVNVKGTLLMSHAAVAVMKRGSGGAIVNLASIIGLVVYPDHFGFSEGFHQGFHPYPHSKTPRAPSSR